MVKSAANQAVEGVLARIQQVVKQDVKDALQSSSSQSSISQSSISQSIASSLAPTPLPTPLPTPPPPPPIVSNSDASVIQSAQSVLAEASNIMQALESSESSSQSQPQSQSSRALDALADRLARRVEQSVDRKIEKALGSISAATQSVFNTNTSAPANNSSAANVGFSALDAVLVSTQERVTAHARAGSDLVLERALKPDTKRRSHSHLAELQNALKAAREAALFKSSKRTEDDEGW